MSAAIELVESLRQQGVRFELAGDKVKFRGNRELLTPERIEALKQSRGEVVEFLRGSPQDAPERPAKATLPDKVGVGGRPVTWTGKVVSLDDWRNLTDWERHGPNGRLWNGKIQQWEEAK